MLTYDVPYKGIVYFPGIVPNIDTLMQKIEKTEGFSITPWEVWYASGNSEGHAYGEIKYFKKEFLTQETSEDIKADSNHIISTLITSMAEAAQEYAKIYSISDKELNYAKDALNHPGTKYGINKYYENQYMGPHVDWNEQNFDITYTIVVYLNDDYEGGELYFVDPEIDVKIKPKKGSIVMFPSTLPYIHQSCEITKGRKMLITHHWKNDSLSRQEDNA
jgi:hypothetical protein